MRDYGSAVMYEPGKILYVGGGDPPTNTAEIINLNQPNPEWMYTGPMAFPRRHLNATVLPTGDVLVTAGTSAGGFNEPLGAVHALDQGTRLVPLSFSQAIGGLSVTLPGSRTTAPPGPYMLFLVNGIGVPSVARIMKLE